MASRVAAFNEGLRDLGYLEVGNLTTMYRWGEGREEKLARIAAELIDLKPDILVVHCVAAARAARNVSPTIPTICFACGDVLSTDLVSTLARPGGNITGITIAAPDVTGKRLQLLQQAIPKLTRLAVLWNLDNPIATQELKETESAARSLGIEVHLSGVRNASELQGAFSSMSNARTHALIVLSDAMLFGQRSQIASLALANHLPAVSWTGEFAKAGGLLSYGPDVLVLSRRAASYVDRILKGAKPADHPIEQPRKFELVVNVTTARALKLAIPQPVLLQAEVVE